MEPLLPWFERARPHDRRPREAVHGGLSWADGTISVPRARALALAAHAAARQTRDPVAQAVARAAAHAVATAHVATHAAGALAYVVRARALAARPGREAAAASVAAALDVRDLILRLATPPRRPRAARSPRG